MKNDGLSFNKLLILNVGIVYFQSALRKCRGICCNVDMRSVEFDEFLVLLTFIAWNCKFWGAVFVVHEGVMIRCCISMHDVRAREGRGQGEGEEVATLC